MLRAETNNLGGLHHRDMFLLMIHVQRCQQGSRALLVGESPRLMAANPVTPVGKELVLARCSGVLLPQYVSVHVHWPGVPHHARLWTGEMHVCCGPERDVRYLRAAFWTTTLPLCLPQWP